MIYSPTDNMKSIVVVLMKIRRDDAHDLGMCALHPDSRSDNFLNKISDS